MFNKKLLVIIVVAAMSVLTRWCYSQNIEGKVDSFFSTLNSQYHLNGCVLMAEEGKILYKKAFGYSDFFTKAKLTTNSMFDLASISKQFTAIGVLILYEQGLLDYSSNIQSFFPQLPYDSITIRNLLNHTSGIIKSDDLINKYWDKSKIITNEDLLRLLEEHQPALAFRPGTEYQYCNTGYILLATIIEKTSGLEYGEFLKRNVFKPIGMNRTMTYRRRYKPEVINDYAFGYVFSLEHGGYALPDSVEKHKRVITLDGLQGDGVINSTVEDLFLWDRYLYTNKIVSQQTLNEAFTPGILRNGSEIDIGFRGDSYGFGWRIHNSEDGKMVWHSGHYPGYSNLILRYLDIDRTIICLSNNGFEWFHFMENINDLLDNKGIILPHPYFDEQLGRILIQNNSKIIGDSIKSMINRRIEYIVSERRINSLGYDLLNLNRLYDAILVFDCNTQLFPSSSNAYDSQGEAYMLNGDYDEAIRSYKRSLELDPENTNALEMLKTINEKQ